MPRKLLKHTSGYVWEDVSRDVWYVGRQTEGCHLECEWHHPIGWSHDGTKVEKKEAHCHMFSLCFSVTISPAAM